MFVYFADIIAKVKSRRRYALSVAGIHLIFQKTAILTEMRIKNNEFQIR